MVGMPFLFSGTLSHGSRTSGAKPCIDKAHYLLQIGLSVDKVDVIAFDDEKRSTVVVGDPVFVMLVKLFEVLALDALFEGSTAP